MDGAALPLLALVGLTLLLTFLNGLNDSGSLVGTIISSGTLSARRAFALAGAAELLGALAGGTAVATTIAASVIEPDYISLRLLLAVVLGALAWLTLAGRLGMPASATHALIGALVGAAFAAGGETAVREGPTARISLALAIGPAAGLIGGWLLMHVALFLVRGFSPRANVHFKRFGLFSAVLIALSHGANDAQKSMMVLTLGLLVAGGSSAGAIGTAGAAAFVVPGWVQVLCAVVLAAGVTVGGGRILRTLGARVYRIRPIHGFTAQTCSAAIVLLATAIGAPMSTTQVATSAIFGVGAADRPSRVRWELGWNIVVVWLVTVPVAALAAALAYWLLAGVAV